MRSIFLISFLILFVLLSAFSGKKFNQSFYSHTVSKKAGVFDRDSLLDALPEYHKALDSSDHYKKLLNNVLASIDSEFVKKQTAFYSDSLKWSPLIKELKAREIIDLESRIVDFKQQAADDLENKKQSLIQPLNENVTFAANVLAKKKKLDTILDKTDSIAYLKLYPTAKFINVTKQIHVLVGPQYKMPAAKSPPAKPGLYSGQDPQ